MHFADAARPDGRSYAGSVEPKACSGAGTRDDVAGAPLRGPISHKLDSRCRRGALRVRRRCSEEKRGGAYGGCEHQERGGDHGDPAPAFAPACLFEEDLDVGWQRVGNGLSSCPCPEIHHDANLDSVMGENKALRVKTDLVLGPVDRTDRMPLHEQVAADVRRAIAEGEAVAGDRIPQAKDLAAVLGVNTNTVLRALRMLREEGLLELGRGRRIVIAGTPDRGTLVAKMKDLLDYGQRHGYRRDELVVMMQELP